ncbi:MAG: hypothetical protein GX614_15255 [Sandaracinaceae bacterium]|nr:hypothetical protein [Sandaracinaceae bacterium]
MKKHLIQLLALSLMVGIVGCDDADGGTPIPRTKEEAHWWRMSYGPCDPDRDRREQEGGGCTLPFDRCLESNDERESLVCATPCETVDDCIGFDEGERRAFTAEIECLHIEGAGHCVLNCSDGKTCPGSSTICVDDRCVIPADAWL